MAALLPTPMAQPKPLMMPNKPPIGHPAVMPNNGSVAGVNGQMRPNVMPPAPTDGPIRNLNGMNFTPERQAINNLPPGIDPRAVAADPQGYQQWQQQRQQQIQQQPAQPDMGAGMTIMPTPGPMRTGSQIIEPYPQQQMPQFGLQGQENALTQAAAGAGQAMTGGMQSGMRTLSGGLNRAGGYTRGANNMLGNTMGQVGQTLGMGYNLGMGNIGQGVGALGGNFGSGVSRGTATDVNRMTGQGQFQQGVNNLNQNFSGQSFTSNAANVDQNTGQNMFNQAAQGFNQFAQYSPEAMQQQAALSGALGQEAFNQAFLNSPVQQFLREQGEESIANQAAATGGLGSGEVLKELTRFGQGLAGTQLQQQIDNLSGIGNRGLQAQQGRAQMMGMGGQQMGQLAGQNASMANQVGMQNAQNQQQASLQNAANRLSAAGQQSNLLGQMGGLEARLAGQNAQNRTNASLQNASMANQVGMSNARNALSAAQGQANLFGQGASLAQGLTGQLGGIQGQLGGQQAQNWNRMGNNAMNTAMQQAQMQYGTGNNLANMLTGVGTQISGARGQAGRDMAQMQRDAAQNQAGNVNTQTQALAELMQAQGMNAMDIISAIGGSGSEGQLAQLLANAASQNATNQSSALSTSGGRQANLDLIRGQNLIDTGKGIYQAGADEGWWGG